MSSSQRGLRLLVPFLFVAVLPLTLPVPAVAEDPFLRRTATVRAVERVGPSVVNITTERIVTRRGAFQRRPLDPIFERFYRNFGRRQNTTNEQSLGSGLIFDSDGHVLTNEHVVAKASRIRVTLSDGREFDTEVVGADPKNDLAVLKVLTDEQLPWTELGNSDDLMVGEPVIAIGNPFGLSNTVTTGVISAINRSVNTQGHTFHGVLQTDASINPGNSGGPLLNAEGALIGINSVMYDGAEGIAFAIPIEVAKRVIQELLEHGKVEPVWLGLEFQNLDPALRDVMDLPQGVTGALINQVSPSGPASKGGARRGDIVTQVDGRSVSSARELFQMLDPVTTGQKLELQVWRDSKIEKLQVVAARVPDEVVDALATRLLALVLTPIDGGGYAVESVRPGTPAEQIGFEPGDRILAINGIPLTGNEELRRAVLNLRGRGRALLVVQRGRGRYNLTVPFP